jgi:hypothetical protein
MSSVVKKRADELRSGDTFDMGPFAAAPNARPFVVDHVEPDPKREGWVLVTYRPSASGRVMVDRKKASTLMPVRVEGVAKTSVRDVMEAIDVRAVMDAPWRFSAGAYQAALGVHEPWIAEISPMQYAHMGKAAKAAYDKKRHGEWEASAAAKRQWEEAVLAAFRDGQFDPKAADVHPDAETVVLRLRMAQDKAAASAVAAQKDRANEITDVGQVKKGDRVFVVISGTYGEVLKVSRKSVQVSGRFGPMKVEVSPRSPMLLWRAPRDLHGEGVTPRTVGDLLAERQKARRVKAMAGVGHRSGSDTDLMHAEFAAQKAVSKHSSDTLGYLANLKTVGHNSKLRKQARKFLGMRGHGCPPGEKMTFGQCRKVGAHPNQEGIVRSIRQLLDEMAETTRAKLPRSAFVFPEERRWPIRPKKYAIYSIQYMVMGRGDSADYPAVKKAIRAEYGDDDEVMGKLKGA